MRQPRKKVKDYKYSEIWKYLQNCDFLFHSLKSNHLLCVTFKERRKKPTDSYRFPAKERFFEGTVKKRVFFIFFWYAYQKIQNSLKRTIWKKKKTKSFQQSQSMWSPLLMITIYIDLYKENRPNWIYLAKFVFNRHILPFQNSCIFSL